MPEAAAPVKGSRPEGVQSEADASKKIREMFTEIAPTYDALNHLLSFQIDRIWRARVARRLRPILANPVARVLDLCCGTGDLALALQKSGRARIIGADFAHTMLVRARAKSILGGSHSGMPAPPPLPLFEADALRLPFADASFDLVTTAFGFRNLANYESGLREIQRVLKPGGTVAILEFTEPPSGPFGALFNWYFRSLLSRIGGAISGHRTAYTYLPKSVSRFFRPAQLADLMSAVDYHSVAYTTWTLGTVALHTGVKPA